MAPPIERIVDAHIHLWDPANAEWYPYLAGQRELDMGDISGMCRLFDQPTYFAESSNWNVVKFVHVAAATAPHSGAETAHLQELAEATGHPDAIIGGIVPQDPIADTERLLDQQMESPRFRGIRPMGGAMGVPGADVLRALAERDLIFELMAHPDVVVKGLSEEHGLLDLSRTDWRPVVGDVVRVIPNHVCIVVHLNDRLTGVRGDVVDQEWSVAARGR